MTVSQENDFRPGEENWNPHPLAGDPIEMLTFTPLEKDMPQDIAATLKERGSRYGRFEDQAKIERAIRDVIEGLEGWDKLAEDQKSAIEMIVVKIARILNGDPNYDDNWRDIAGYAQLIVNRLNGEPSE